MKSREEYLKEIESAIIYDDDLVVGRLEEIIREICEQMIGEYEHIGLPTTQAQEQSNYNKKQRNELRKELRQRLNSLLPKEEAQHE